VASLSLESTTLIADRNFPSGTFYDDVSVDLEAVPTFARLEPGPGQRWTTWPSVVPTSRGPKPHPDWLVTSAGAFDTELGVVKSGKEADLFLIERAVPGDIAQSCVLAAKRYRGAETSDFHRSDRYQEGRKERDSRSARAMARGSAFGRTVAAGRWAYAEFTFLFSLFERGLPVPYPVQVNDTEILMEFIGAVGVAAPRLAQLRLHGAELADHYAQVRDILIGFAEAGLAHGDLSPYNLLVHNDRVVVIDLPQVVDLVANPAGLELLHRDCVNVCDWFVRRGYPCDAEELFGELVGLAF
jgi:RIO kinase 1